MDVPTLVHHDDERLRLVSTGALLLAHVRLGYTHAESLEIHAAQEYLRATVGRHAVIAIVSEVRTELSERALEFSRRTTAEFADWVVCVAHVIEPRGVIGAVVRCVMAGMRAVNKPPYPVREFSSMRAAAMWTAPLLVAAELDLALEPTPGGLLEWLELARAPDLLESGQVAINS